MLETIPTPAEFRDAIESLSPEQQRFAKAYRGMQLASTLFAVAIVQIKPQLERLLGLPNDRYASLDYPQFQKIGAYAKCCFDDHLA